MDSCADNGLLEVVVVELYRPRSPEAEFCGCGAAAAVIPGAEEVEEGAD